MNMTTARSGNRAKEVGLRKVVGSHKTDLVKQFLGESLLLSFFALLLALILVLIVLPVFNNVSGKHTTIFSSGNILILLILTVITLFTGLFAGSYPAFFLSSFQPVKVLKGTLRSSSKNVMLRRLLVIIQFSLSIILIISTFVISGQLSYIRNKNMGYNRDHVLVFPGNRSLRSHIESFKRDLMQNPLITSVATSDMLPTNYSTSTNGVEWEGKNPDDNTSLFITSVDYDYITTLEMELISGRNFSRDFTATGPAGYIINEEALKVMGFDSPVSKRLTLWNKEGTIVGVVKNFHFKSLHEKIAPTILRLNPRSFSYVFVKIGGENIAGTLNSIKKIWETLAPGNPFEYNFLDETFDGLYKSEQRAGKIFSYFTFLALFVSCLGIFGLAAFMAEQRTKEIGIRKVLGATVPTIILLLSREFVVLVALANVIAWPVAYFTMNKWLKSYAYHTDMTIMTFIFSAMIALVIALITVGYQSVKAASVNPVTSLKNE